MRAVYTYVLLTQFGEYYVTNKHSRMMTAAINVKMCREEMAKTLLISSVSINVDN